jgi:hypothetical protein
VENRKNRQACVITKEDGLNAIHDFKTTSAKEFSEILQVPGADVYVILGELTQADVSRALGVQV